VGFEFGFVVAGVESDFPGGVVNRAVVMAAQQHEIRQTGFTAGYPVVDVMRVAHHRWSVAAGERAAGLL
jgi:hypothetical protein